ncbi:hypothetical protein OROHE_003919 [Orobanche hederae]
MAHPPPYEPYYLAPPPTEYGYSVGERNGINTLFVSGLPDDVMPREIHNLFRRRPGFESCQLKYTGRGNQVVAFATFVNHQSAIAALHSLNGVKFDPQTSSTLHIELARSNSRRKHKPGSGPYVVIDNRTKSANDARESSTDDDGDSDEPTTNVDTYQYDSARDKRLINSSCEFDETNLESDSTGKATNSNDAPDPENILEEQAEERTDGACSTLFIANLGPNCTETELKQHLSECQGFNSLKVRARGGMPVAFADFERICEVENEEALNHDAREKIIGCFQVT